MYKWGGPMESGENPEMKKRSWKEREDAVKKLTEDGCARVSDERLMQVIREVRSDGKQITITFQGGENWLFGPDPLAEEFQVHEEW